MRFRWIRQTHSNACVPSVLIMLLSEKGIHLDIRDFVERCHMPFMIQYDPLEQGYQCGFLAYQTVANYRNCSLVHGLDIEEYRTGSLECFLDEIDRLLAGDTAIMLGIPTSSLPYSHGSTTGNGRHALLLYGHDRDGYHFLDSDGGLARNQEVSYDDVRKQVDYSLSTEAFRYALSTESDSYALMYLKQAGDCRPVLDREDILRESIRSVGDLHRLTTQRLQTTRVDSGIDYSRFHDFTFRLVKPFVIDLFTVHEIMGINPGFRSFLRAYREETFRYMNALRSGPCPSVAEIFAYFDNSALTLQSKLTQILHNRLGA